MYIVGEDLRKELIQQGYTHTQELLKASLVVADTAELINTNGAKNFASLSVEKYAVINSKQMYSIDEIKCIKNAGFTLITKEKLLPLLEKQRRVEIDDQDNQVIFEDDETEIQQPVLITQAKMNKNFIEKHIRQRLTIAVYSAAGGVGKTTTALNIAAACGISGHNVVCIDFDLNFGDTDMAAGMTDPHRRNKIICRDCYAPKGEWVNIANWRTFVYKNIKENTLRHGSGFNLIPAYPYTGMVLPYAEAEDLLKIMRDIYDIIIVDLGVDAFSEHAQAALQKADLIINVGGQDEKTIGKIIHFKSVFNDFETEKIKLIVNMVRPTGRYTAKELAEELGFKEYYEVPFDEAGCMAAKNMKKLFVQLDDSEAGTAYWQFAKNVLPLTIADTVPSSNKGTSLFKKLVPKFFTRRG
ncbi:hypothetical protein JCM39194_25370 [Desulfotomaculum varum]